MKGGDKLKKIVLIMLIGIMALVMFAATAGAEPTEVEEALTFSLDLSDLGGAIGAALGSLTPVFLVPAGLIVAAAILSFGIAMFSRWRAAGGRR